MKKTILNTTLAAVIGFVAVGAQAAVLNNGDVLTITNGQQIGTPSAPNVGNGSFFAMDLSSDQIIQPGEKTAINGLAGITIGATSTNVAPVIDSWFFNNGDGFDFVSTAVTGGTTNGLDMSGWTVRWGGSDIPMGVGGAWTPTNCAAATMSTTSCVGYSFVDQVADFVWDGNYGSTYTLWYSARVPAGAPFAGTDYALYLTGTVVQGAPPVPVPAAVWLFGSGLLGLIGVARRKANRA